MGGEQRSRFFGKNNSKGAHDPAAPAVNVSITQILDSDEFKVLCRKACQDTVQREMSMLIDKKIAAFNDATQLPLQKKLETLSTLQKKVETLSILHDKLEQLSQDTSIINGQLTMLSNKDKRQPYVYGAPVLMPFDKLQAIAKSGINIDEDSTLGKEMIKCALTQIMSWCDSQQGNYAWLSANDANRYAAMGLTHEQAILVNRKGGFVYNFKICKAIVGLIGTNSKKLYLMRNESDIDDLDDNQQAYHKRFQVVFNLFTSQPEKQTNEARKLAEQAWQEVQDDIADENTKGHPSTDHSKKSHGSNHRRVKFAAGTKRLFV